MRGAASSPSRFSALPASPARGGSTTTTSGSPARSRSSRSTSPTLPAKNAVLPIAFSSAFSIAQATDSSEISIPHTVSASRGHREPDRADPAVEVVDGLAARETGELARELVQPLGHLACSSAGTRSAARGSAGRRSPPRSRPRPRGARSAGSSPRPRLSLTDQWIDRTSGNSVSTSISRSRSKRSPRVGHELDERLAGVAALADAAGGGGSPRASPGRRRRAAPRAPSRASRCGSRCRARSSASTRSISSTSSQRPARCRPSVGPVLELARTSTPSCCGSRTATPPARSARAAGRRCRRAAGASRATHCSFAASCAS